MTTARIGMAGLPPTVIIKPTNPEREKYKRMWEQPDYRRVAPGEFAATAFLAQARLHNDAEVLDFGCGTGRGALIMDVNSGVYGHKVTMLDFAGNCLDPEVRQALGTQNGRLKFFECDLTKPITQRAAYGFCTDVMEHIPTHDVPMVLNNILASAQTVFFQINTVTDNMGVLIGRPLHLTVRAHGWWRNWLEEVGAEIIWERKDDNSSLFLVRSTA